MDFEARVNEQPVERRKVMGLTPIKVPNGSKQDAAAGQPVY